MERRILHRKRMNSILAVVLIIALLLSLFPVFPMAQEQQWSNQIQRFERRNPIDTKTVEPGTKREELNLAEYVRAVVDIPEGMDTSTFKEAKPEVDLSDGYEHYDYFDYGYIAPKDKTKTKDGKELSIYQLNYDDQEQGKGETAYRIYGSVAGSDNVWFACKEDGQITGAVLDVPVDWSGDYQPDKIGEYTFTAQCSDYEYAAEPPTVVITVRETPDVEDKHDHGDEEPTQSEETVNTDPEAADEEETPQSQPLADCHCGKDGTPIDANNFPWAHQPDCKYYGPVECLCREQIEEEVDVEDEDGTTHKEIITVPGEYTHVHDKNNKDCPLYGKELEENSRSGRSINSRTGSNSDAQDDFMTEQSPTSGNRFYDSPYTNGIVISGSWVDYVNTIWMNKAVSKFHWTQTSDMPGLQSPNDPEWSWRGVASYFPAGDPETDPKAFPVRQNMNWDVYSGEQLRHALTELVDRDTITLQADIDLNGAQYSWDVVDCKNFTITIHGNGHKIFNLGQMVKKETDNSMFSAFIRNYKRLVVDDLEFVTCKMVSNQECVGIFRGNMKPQSQNAHLQNIHIRDSLFYSSAGNLYVQDGQGRVSPFGYIENSRYTEDMNTNVTMENCTTEGNYIYGRDHVTAFALGLGNANSATSQMSEVKNSYAVDNLVCGTGGHSAGFSSCFAYNTRMTNCFAVNEIYGSAMTSGFVGFLAGQFNNCYSSGKVEGYSRMAGFAWDSDNNARTFNSCYSTALVGLRSKPTEQGGFIVGQTADSGTRDIMNNCYAAGEVGNFDVDLNTPNKTVGGFYSSTASSGWYTLNNCYYDKQTTAMREWVSGDSKQRLGVTGVLTSSTEKAGTGLADRVNGYDESDPGFKGFRNPIEWTYKVGFYPQLRTFANADPLEWGSKERADRVKAYSLASVSTVRLNTWENGYDWDSSGVRSDHPVSYNRESGAQEHHKGNADTYDTVREIITDASYATEEPSAGSVRWEHMIAGGAPVDTNGDDQKDGMAMEVSNGTLQVKNPGMDWFQISAEVGGQKGYRPIRLISYMSLDAGSDKTIEAGYRYDHREDVSLTMMDKITENLVVGFHDDSIWSRAKTGGYPDSKRFWAVPTTNIKTEFSASKNAQLYTEIWRAEQNQDGSFATSDTEGIGDEHLIPDRSVKVTGPGTGEGTTISEQKWNGEFPFNEDISKPRKYLITYYWMLEDGRYRADTKTITVDPSKYTVDVQVKNDRDKESGNNTALQLGAAADNQNDTAYTYSASPVQKAQAEQVPYTNNAALAWKKASDTAVIKGGKLTMYAHDGTELGTKEFSGDLNDGDQLTIPVTYYYNKYEGDNVQEKKRELTEKEVVNVTYTVHKDSDDGFYLRFNKIANLPEDEVTGVNVGDPGGIPAGTKAYINDVQYNIDLTFYVNADMPFTFKKTDESGHPLSGVEFEIYACKEGHTDTDQHSTLAESGSCWDVDHPKDTVTSDENGIVSFDSLTTGDYILAETKAKSGYQLPKGQWLLQVDHVQEKIEISARGEKPPAFKKEADGTLSLANYRDLSLPGSGGYGANLYLIGSIILIGTAVMLILVYRRKARE